MNYTVTDANLDAMSVREAKQEREKLSYYYLPKTEVDKLKKRLAKELKGLMSQNYWDEPELQMELDEKIKELKYSIYTLENPILV